MSTIQDVADFVGTPQSCSICGTGMYEGGMWRGAKDIFICGPECASNLIQLVLDTLIDTDGPEVRWADWMKMAAREYDRWEHGKRVQQRHRSTEHIAERSAF